MRATGLSMALAIVALSPSLSACGGGTKTVTVTVPQTTTTTSSRGGTGNFPDYMYTTVDASCAFIESSGENARIFANNVVDVLNTPQAPGPLKAKIIGRARRVCRSVKNLDYAPGTKIVSELVVGGAAGT
jgi:hypothetical protein